MRITDLIYYDWYYMLLMPFLVSILCVLTNRLFGRKEESCPTWKDKWQMIFIYCMCLFMNMFFIWLLMLSNECWLMHHWGISK